MENLFVYGTLMKDVNQTMYNLIQQEGIFLGKATLNGKLFLVDYYPGSIPSTNKNDCVIGEVYALKNAAKVFVALDAYEEYNPAEEEKSEFIRRKIDVKLESGEKIKAWVYFYNFPTSGLKFIPSGDFRHHIQESKLLPKVVKA